MSIPGTEVLVKARSKWMVHLDPPDHTQIRAVVNKAFTPGMVSSMSEGVRAIAERTWNAVSGARRASLWASLLFLMCSKPYFNSLAYRKEDHPQFGIWARTVAERTNKGLDLQTDIPMCNFP